MKMLFICHSHGVRNAESTNYRLHMNSVDSGQKFNFGPFGEVIISYNGILELSSIDWH